MLSALCVSAQAQSADAKPTESKPPETRGGSESYATIYLHNATQQNDLNDIQTALRNMLTKARIYGVPSQSSISLRANAEDLQQAQKIVADLDRPKPTYRLTYTINESESGKRVGSQHFTLIVISGGRSEFKQGSRVPLVTGSTSDGTTTQNTVTYVDVGLDIEAFVDGSPDGVRVRSKVVQSSVSEEKSGIGMQDPMIRQTSLDGSSTLAPGKPLVLGSLDVPGSTRHIDVEVVAEQVK
jgi:type II secretory pathway component GspD/PulD (secretin)